MTEIADKLLKKGIKLVIFAPLPVFRGVANPPPDWACTKEWFRPFASKSCSSYYQEKRSNIEVRNQSIRDAFERTQSKYSNVYIYDPFDLLCPSKSLCKTIVDDTKIFRDDDHLSRDGARYLYKDFNEFLYTNNILRSK